MSGWHSDTLKPLGTSQDPINNAAELGQDVKQKDGEGQKGSGATEETTEHEQKKRDQDDLDFEVQFSQIGVREYLDLDPRPSFVVDLAADLDIGARVSFCNRSFRSDPRLINSFLSIITANKFDVPFVASGSFRSWMKGLIRRSERELPDPTSFKYLGIDWTGFIVLNRWGVISGNQIAQRSSGLVAGEKSHSTRKRQAYGLSENQSRANNMQKAPEFSALPHRSSEVVLPKFETSGTPDWTIANPIGELPPHILLARNCDWTSTPLGGLETWSAEFRQIANLLMANPHPCAIFWGEELTVMYNKAYADSVAGNKHPTLMGTGLKGPFAEMWSTIEPTFVECRKNNKAVAVYNQMLPLERHSLLEETYWTWSLTLLYGGTNTLLGFYNAPFETTRATITDRRMRTLLNLSEELAHARTISSFWMHVLKPLEENYYDFPFALLYSVFEDSEIDDVSSNSSESSQAFKSCILQGTIGVPEGHAVAQRRLDLRRSSGGFIPVIRDAMQTWEPRKLSIQDGTLSANLVEGLEPRGFNEPCQEAIVCPLRPTTGETVFGFLVVGINPRRPYDDDYKSFIVILNRQLGTALASVAFFEDEQKRGYTAAEAASLERLRLSEELAVQRSRLQHMAELSPVGMFSVDTNGLLVEANDRWFEVTGHSRDIGHETSWMDKIADSSREVLDKGWVRLSQMHLPWSSELKLKKPWHNPDTGEWHEAWILADFQPEFSMDGTIRSIMGSITDISHQKRSATEAEARALLSEQLLLRTQEAKENEKNFKRFSDLAPGGLIIMDPQRRITYANKQWFAISGYPQDSDDSTEPVKWSNVILEEDYALFMSKWNEVVHQGITVTLEIRMKTPWEGDVGGTQLIIQRWILASMFPEVSEDGVLKSVMGCITDISRIKWAIGVQSRRLEEAEETRRSQLNFIDITSHEMRNPLSAIVQCADDISRSLEEYRDTQNHLAQDIALVIKDGIDAAETIQLCAQHQKSIVDDILTISKLDSNLLLITPVAVRPVEVVRNIMKIFVAECVIDKIEMNLIIEDSYKQLGVDVVMLDSSRLRQVLINLMTNAIKFTKSEKKRLITISAGVYLAPPPKRTSNFDYFPTNQAKSDVTAREDWGRGQVLYLRFEVQDSGCGLTPDERQYLFQRFAQASPRTHVKYGGTGLGLFISRQLSELQGGEIGVASEAGKGSTFAFFMKSRRAEMADHEITSTDTPNLHTQEAALALKEEYSKQIKPLKREPLAPSDLHILVVEDNLVNQRILAAQIRKLGCTVYVANHGGEALDVIRESRFYEGNSGGKDLSVVLMDLEMPIMDGLTCVRRIREMEGEGLISIHVPVIAVTANARGEQVEAALKSGMDDLIPKPFRVRELMVKIDALLSETIRPSSAK